jgi:4-hydroxybenzoate polyprenyltransferase
VTGTSLAARLANFVKLPHTVFAMPFALVGVAFASRVTPVSWRVFGWVLVAFTAARFAAMAFNRLVDRTFDAANPRTANRELPSGALTVTQARVAVVVASGIFLVAAWQLNPLCLALSPLALGWILAYSYTKRFTRFAHVWLGLGLSIAPVGGFLAVTGAWSDPWWMLCALALGVMCWSGGFDTIYALQDAEFDRSHGLFSLPSTLGVAGAISVSRALHVAAVVCFAATMLGNPLRSDREVVRALLAVAVVGVAAMLVYEHRLVRADDLSKVDAAFFTMNGLISIGFLTLVVAARVAAGGAT